MNSYYQNLRDNLAAGRNKRSRPLGAGYRNCRILLRTEDEVILFQYHQTVLAEIYPDGRVVLNCKGWRSATTKEKLSHFLNPIDVHLFQQDLQWYLVAKGVKYAFQDGMELQLDEDGQSVVAVTGAMTEKQLEAERKLHKKVKEYATVFIDRFFAGDVPPPSNGDCFYCHFVNAETKIPLHEGTPASRDHLLRHIFEPYYVPSLLARAIVVFPVGSLTAMILSELWRNRVVERTDFQENARRQLFRSLHSYLKREIGIA